MTSKVKKSIRRQFKRRRIWGRSLTCSYYLRLGMFILCIHLLTQVALVARGHRDGLWLDTTDTVFAIWIPAFVLWIYYSDQRLWRKYQKERSLASE
jgi:hypothetical protein